MSSRGFILFWLTMMTVLYFIYFKGETSDNNYIVDSTYSSPEQKNELITAIPEESEEGDNNFSPKDSSIEGYNIESSPAKNLVNSSSLEPERPYRYAEKDVELERILDEADKLLKEFRRTTLSANNYYNRPYGSNYSTNSNTRPLSNGENNVNSERVYVNGYYKSNGTYVESYIRTAPNSSIDDNFSYNSNYNPYTGQKGSIYR